MARGKRLHKRRKAREAAAWAKWKREQEAYARMVLVSGPYWEMRLWRQDELGQNARDPGVLGGVTSPPAKG